VQKVRPFAQFSIILYRNKKNKMGVISYIFVVILTILPYFTNTTIHRREREREEREDQSDTKMRMECLGLSFVDRKSTKVITNTAGIHCLARHSGIAVDAALRLLPFKTKAHAHRALRKYQITKARLAAKKKSTGWWKIKKSGWHAKLLKRQQQLLQQDSARA
jgi:hypothetical protein